MITNVDFKKTIEDAFLAYGASVAQERAIPDVRDGLKIGLRQGLYSQYVNKLTFKDRFQKAQKSVAGAMALAYVHGDSALYDTLIRASKPWVYNVPLEAVQGAYGDQTAPDTHSASRYVEMKAAKVADYLFEGLKKNAVDEWYNNYDDTAKIPSVFPSIGFWNIINGCSGIAVALSTSVPCYNLKEVNAALIKLIQNPDTSFDEIYCEPDFPTGGTIINKDEVKESLRMGKGKSIKIKADLTYDPKTHCIKATHLPYGVYTNTIISQLAELTNENENYGISRVLDYTKKEADIRIYLSKGVNPQKMMKKLYADTSLQDFYTVNMVMLDQGKFPKVFGWKEACEAYLAHASSCFRKEYEYDLNILKAREEILNGLLLAIANIDEVVSIIRSSSSSADATTKLIARFSFTQNQVKAILDMKLQRLIRLEGIKIEDELKSNQKSQSSINEILTNKEKFNSELIKVFQKVADEFGDERRTKVINEVEEVEEESVQEIPLYIYQLSTGELAVRAKSASRFPKADILAQYETTNFGSLYYFTKDGKCGKISLQDKEVGKNYPIDKDVVAIMEPDTITSSHYLVFFTKKGMVKKSLTSEYNMHSKKTTAIKLKDDDEVVSVILTGDESVLDYRIISQERILRFSADCVSSTGRITMGVKGISLKDDDEVISGEAILKNELLDCTCSIRAGVGTRR